MDTVQQEGRRVSTYTAFFQGCVRSLYRACIKPKATNEEAARKEFILNVILSGSVIFLTALELFLLYKKFVLASPPGIPLSIFTAIYLISIVLFFIARRGYVTLASYILLGLYLAGLAYGTIIWGPDLYQIVLTYALILVIAGILCGSRVALGVAAIASIVITIAVYLNSQHIIVFDQRWRFDQLELNDAIELSITFFMITLISWLSNREITKSLARAHASEAALTRERDLLEMKVEERTLELRRLQAQKVSELYRFAEFGRMSSGIFHDLINPLSSVVLNVQELESNSVHRVQEYIDRAISASKRMERFITIAQKQLGSSETSELLHLEQEMRDVLILLNYKILKMSARVYIKAVRTIKTRGNSLKFQQIIANLISNALDACDDPTLGPERRVVYVSIAKKRGYAHVSVRDKGCGIPAELLPKIFDPFFTTKSSHKGMGLGLSTTKDAVEKDFNGCISVKSIHGQGSTFLVTFPIVRS